MKIAFVVGARPQFIKLAPFCQRKELLRNTIIIHTGQHFDKEMSDLFFNELNIPEPNYYLGINSGNHGEQTGKMLIALESMITKELPDFIIVFGDTNTTLAGALVGSKLHIPVIHIEAGLRSFNKKMPEEINRIVADHISDYLFVPTKTALNNLKKENLSSKSYLTGDIMVDSLKMVIKKVRRLETYSKYSLTKNNYYLLTLHRPYNVDNPLNLIKILTELNKLGDKILFPVHPRTLKVIEDNSISIPPNIVLVKPVGYFDFINLLSNCKKIITDSGGVQKEAYILEKICITLRSETEWIETVESGWNLLVNPYTNEDYHEKIKKFLPPFNHPPIFGDDVTNKMVEIINNIEG
ncbi:UDP-N-acetylglucosamine 2-epimerase [Melioribacter roseus P3M-2]|uniref:UDP-N-acetylglucosamine 2-epimerase n=1 Tax=Melioribacter roseus (strain DSM 23840 / JCM 17771 / VKM B-2668 / P3M-2) TaxID=1191523 RepID=I7A3Z8_MELRP|nr:UDP-N-acetylglucosamine 2-epimerase (non-hydrolyzing) [Melioribacter roseus]AFN75903.1 UDP-N-acetylglucosamine 2-epimerase [Melioribacter roseus P3M-2]